MTCESRKKVSTNDGLCIHIYWTGSGLLLLKDIYISIHIKHIDDFIQEIKRRLLVD